MQYEADGMDIPWGAAWQGDAVYCLQEPGSWGPWDGEGGLDVT